MSQFRVRCRECGETVDFEDAERWDWEAGDEADEFGEVDGLCPECKEEEGDVENGM